jgi:hypothetical protein
MGSSSGQFTSEHEQMLLQFARPAIRGKINEESLLYVSNATVNTSIPWDVHQFRIFFAFLVVLKENNYAPRKYEISIKELYQRLGLVPNKAFEVLSNPESLRVMQEQVLTEVNGRNHAHIPFFYSIEYIHNRGLVQLSPHPQMLPYYEFLNQQWTSAHLKTIGSLRSSYSMKLFLLLSQFKNTGWRAMRTDDLKKQLFLSDLYGNTEIKRWVINRAMNELKGTDCEFTFEYWQKEGKNIGFRFELVKRPGSKLIEPKRNDSKHDWSELDHKLFDRLTKRNGDPYLVELSEKQATTLINAIRETHEPGSDYYKIVNKKAFDIENHLRQNTVAKKANYVWACFKEAFLQTQEVSVN